jgi:hypothetical protein
VEGLYGVEINAGAYGVHNFRRGQLGLDYHGAYRRYNNFTYYNGSEQAFALKYTYQGSRRFLVTLQESAGSLIWGNNGVAASATSNPNSGLNRSAVFFDSRLNYLQSTAALTWLKSARTSFTMSGSGFLQDRKQSVGLTNSWGYELSGGVNRRVSRANSIGAEYLHSHFEFPGFGMIADTNAYHGTFSSDFARNWRFSLQAGVAITEVQMPFSITLNPILAALFGQRTISGVSYNRNLIPSGNASLRKQFQRAALSFNYSRGVTSGNGWATTWRLESATAEFSYTGLRRVTLAVGGGYYNISGIGQGLGKTAQYTFGGGTSYHIGKATHLNVRYDYRDQQISSYNYTQQGSRVSIGMMFSPGAIPLSIW